MSFYVFLFCKRCGTVKNLLAVCQDKLSGMAETDDTGVLDQCMSIPASLHGRHEATAET